MEQRILNLIAEGEKKTTEFKLCKNELTKSIYETVCAFLNTNGGTIILGVNDNREIEGVNRDKVDTIKKDFTTSMNNPQFINPTYILPLEEIEKDGELLLYIQVPESSEVHKYKNKIFIRNHEGDFDISNNRIELTNLYLLKQQNYTENRVYPYVNIEEDLKGELIEKVKEIFYEKTGNENWKRMDTLTFLKKNSLYLKNSYSGEWGINLAGLLLFGTDLIIHQNLPGYMIDLLKRVNDTERYDDREIIECNLIEAYYKCLEFIDKHLPDIFYLEGRERISLRNIIFREIIANMLIHTEYTKNEISRFTIYKDRIETTNGNKPHFNKIIDIDNCEAFPKNPTIAKIFRILKITEQIGSGTMKLSKYCEAYGGSKPLMVDEDKFKFILPINVFEVRNISYKIRQAENKNSAQQDDTPNKIKPNKINKKESYNRKNPSRNSHQENTNKINNMVKKLQIKSKILDFCTEGRSLQDIMKLLDMKDRVSFKNLYLTPLIQQHKLSMTIPDKPTSKYQKYITIEGKE